jgi:LysM repeat protein
MTKCAPVWRPFLLLLLAISLVGCSQFRRDEFADEKDPHFLEGERRESGMDWDGAIQAYERALQSNPNNAAAHLELGILYGEKKNDFATAVYHYQKHLTLHTNSPRREAVLQQIAFCKGELAKTHAVGLLNRDVQRDLEKLMTANDAYRKRIEQLEAELARGPRYITNYVTNFYKVPDFSQEKSKSLTQPATLVETPQREIVQRDDPPQRVDTRRNPTGERRSDPSDLDRPRPRTQTAGNSASSGRAESAPATRARTHVVRPGDTLARIAQRYNVSVAELRAANPSAAKGTRAGQTLVIPAK